MNCDNNMETVYILMVHFFCINSLKVPRTIINTYDRADSNFYGFSGKLATIWDNYYRHFRKLMNWSRKKQEKSWPEIWYGFYGSLFIYLGSVILGKNDVFLGTKSFLRTALMFIVIVLQKQLLQLNFNW